MAVLAPMPERQREHGDGSETGILAQHTQAVANISEEVFEERPLPHFAAALLDLQHVAKFPPRGEGGFFPRHAAGHQSLDLLGKVRLNLRVEVTIKTPAREKLLDPVHNSPGGAGASGVPCMLEYVI